MIARARAQGTTPEALVREAIEPILSAVSENLAEMPPAPDNKTPKEHRPIWEVITERMNTLPPEVFDRLPKDGASEHDHYLYGSPKRNQ